MAAIPQKPENSQWTDEQWEAIVRRQNNILVAAAAGSGKTAVLVERIIRRISDDRDPVDVDRLLVATFTKAAASEMRLRIRDALEKELFRRPESEHLRRQLALINRASITTLHSFCMEVIQRYFPLIDLDPGFRIADETEAELMRQEGLEELLEEKYAEAEDDSPFWGLVEWFGGERSDGPLFDLIQRLYDASRSHPEPERWLKRMAGMYADAGNGLPDALVETEDQAWFRSLIGDVRLELQGVADLLREAHRLCLSPGGPHPYAETLEGELALAQYLLAASEQGWGPLYEAFQTAGFGRLKACKADDVDKTVQEQVKHLRDAAKEKLNRLKEELFGRSPEQFFAELQGLAPLMEELAGLVSEFARKYKQAKTEKGVVDFADLEHYCLEILREPAIEGSEWKPSQASLAYREQFVEILLDEYQDTNQVQEAIVFLISRSEPGNRFMVGDVKQSIYRFRLAEPGLFLEKYKAYGSTGEEAGRRIDLARNFRSRRQVVDGVNYVFRQIMSETVAEMEYDRSAELVCGAKYPEREEEGIYAVEPDGDSLPDYAVELMLIDRGAEGGLDEQGADSAADFGGDEDGGAEQGDTSSGGTADAAEELETAQLEGRLIAGRIRRLLGLDGGIPFSVTEKSGLQRPATYRDVVILLRATKHWAPVILEELRLAGIPAYADLNAGYFAATEVDVVLSLLKVIDNPFQDIPLAAVLRSPLVGLSADELAQVRIASKQGPYYQALLNFLDANRAAQHSLSRSQEGLVPPGEEGQTAWEWEGDGFKESAAAAEQGTTALADAPLANGKETLADSGLGMEADSLAEGAPIGGSLAEKLEGFRRKLESWRTAAREGSLADLIWNIYRETGYYDFAGGLPGGAQRQANLRALYDRARQYEATSFRGLFRFLRFVERMQESGGDLGTARALGEQEDVVRIMSIHKSKGLEFPVVFVAGMGKMFNQQDLNGSFLIHKELGFGPKAVDTALRVSCPTLPQLAIRRRMRMEMLAEEMRVLYVALTRPKEKLYLLGTVASASKKLRAWARLAEHAELALPDHELAHARTYLDWLGPVAMRHPSADNLRQKAELNAPGSSRFTDELSAWRFSIIDPSGLAPAVEDVQERQESEAQRLSSIRKLAPVDTSPSALNPEIEGRLSFTYPYQAATGMLTKTTVSELKRLNEQHILSITSDASEQALPELPFLARTSEVRKSTGAGSVPEYRKPKFLSARRRTAAETGTIYHAVMQHVPLGRTLNAAAVRALLGDLVMKRLLTEEQAEAVKPEVIVSFYESDIGKRFAEAERVLREVPFSYGLRAGDVYPDAAPSVADEIILIQGVIDCLIEDGSGLVLLDYKTDAVNSQSAEQLASRHKVQLELYGRAVEHIWKRKVDDTYVFFFDGPHLVRL